MKKLLLLILLVHVTAYGMENSECPPQPFPVKKNNSSQFKKEFIKRIIIRFSDDIQLPTQQQSKKDRLLDALLGTLWAGAAQAGATASSRAGSYYLSPEKAHYLDPYIQKIGQLLGISAISLCVSSKYDQFDYGPNKWLKKVGMEFADHRLLELSQNIVDKNLQLLSNPDDLNESSIFTVVQRAVERGLYAGCFKYIETQEKISEKQKIIESVKRMTLITVMLTTSEVIKKSAVQKIQTSMPTQYKGTVALGTAVAIDIFRSGVLRSLYKMSEKMQKSFFQKDTINNLGDSFKSIVWQHLLIYGLNKGLNALFNDTEQDQLSGSDKPYFQFHTNGSVHYKQ